MPARPRSGCRARGTGTVERGIRRQRVPPGRQSGASLSFCGTSPTSEGPARTVRPVPADSALSAETVSVGMRDASSERCTTISASLLRRLWSVPAERCQCGRHGARRHVLAPLGCGVITVRSIWNVSRSRGSTVAVFGAEPWTSAVMAAEVAVPRIVVTDVSPRGWTRRPLGRRSWSTRRWHRDGAIRDLTGGLVSTSCRVHRPAEVMAQACRSRTAGSAAILGVRRATRTCGPMPSRCLRAGRSPVPRRPSGTSVSRATRAGPARQGPLPWSDDPHYPSTTSTRRGRRASGSTVRRPRPLSRPLPPTTERGHQCPSQPTGSPTSFAYHRLAGTPNHGHAKSRTLREGATRHLRNCASFGGHDMGTPATPTSMPRSPRPRKKRRADIERPDEGIESFVDLPGLVALSGS